MTGLPILFKLLIAHFAGDFVLQSSWIVENRNKSLFNKALVYHLLIHLICILVLFLFQIDWRIVSVIVVSHAAIDMLKAGVEMRLNRSCSENEPREIQWNLQRWRISVFVADQLLHLSVIVGAWLIFTGQNCYFLNFSVPDRWWLIALAYLLITTPTGIFIGKLVRRWYHQIMTGTEAATGTVTGSLGGLPQAGSWIGVIERVLTLSFILAGSFEAIGFLLAAKSILRIGDLKEDHEHKKTEYILIGTLLSFGITILLGLGLVMLLKEF